jgi:hypothetical protein
LLQGGRDICGFAPRMPFVFVELEYASARFGNPYALCTKKSGYGSFDLIIACLSTTGSRRIKIIFPFAWIAGSYGSIGNKQNSIRQLALHFRGLQLS